jgi:hypothetical protein
MTGIRSYSLFYARQLEYSGFQPLVPQHKSIPIPNQSLQPICAARTEHEQMTALWVLSDHGLHPLGHASPKPIVKLASDRPRTARKVNISATWLTKMCKRPVGRRRVAEGWAANRQNPTTNQGKVIGELWQLCRWELPPNRVQR